MGSYWPHETKKGNVSGDTGLGTKRRNFVGPVSPPGTMSWRYSAGAPEKEAGSSDLGTSVLELIEGYLRPHLPQWAHGKG